MIPPRVFDAQRKPVPLGEALGRGGEGEVFELAAQRDSAAKLYLRPPDRAKAEKIAAMVAMATPRLTALSAWPTASLHLQNGALAGFVMPKLAGHRPVFQVYGLKLRLRQFPKADWRFLVHAAGNVARAFAAMHATGLVVGDVNHGNLFVAQDATVRFIDTDSFQVTQGARRWTCEVGVGTHQPPEMQGLASYRDVVRTPNHDNFGLAVLIFQLLCIGKHPFSGRYAGAGEPPDIERAITESRYAYSSDQRRTQMMPAPGSLPMAALPAGISQLFEQAFAPGGERGGRPAAEQWIGELSALGKNLRRCGVNAAHWYAAQAQSCPWCAIEAGSGTVLFPAIFLPGQTPSAGIALLWQAIEAVPEPTALPRLGRPAAGDVEVSPHVLAIAGAQRRRRSVAALVLVAGLLTGFALDPGQAQTAVLATATVSAIGLWCFPRPPERRQLRRELAKTRALWTELEADWVQGAAAASFGATRDRLGERKLQYEALPGERERQVQKLASHRREHQLAAHLESFELSTARIPGIGKAKVATLLSYGIETVADFDAARLAAVPGFGPKTVANMLAYRQTCEAEFRFNPDRSVAPAEIAKLDARLAWQRSEIEAELTTGLAQLKAIAAAEQQRQQALQSRAAELWPILAQALTNAAALGVAR